MNKKVQLIMKNLTKKKGVDEENENKDPNEIKKERFLFGNPDSERKNQYLVKDPDDPENEDGILNSSGIVDDKKSSHSGGLDVKKNGTTNSNNELTSKMEDLNDE
jgi:hypothetical protein